MLHLSEPRIIERGPYHIVGFYSEYQGENEGPGWAGAYEQFNRRQHEITHRVDDMQLGFLYQPHEDHPEISAEIKACFIGVEVADFDHVPAGMATKWYSGGKYVVVECRGDVQEEASEGVGKAITQLMQWIPEHGYTEGDACLAGGHEKAIRPPYIEYVFIKLEEPPTA